VPWASVDATAHVAGGVKLNARIRVASSLTAASQATVQALIISHNGVITQLAVLPAQVTIPGHSIVTFDASGPLRCETDGSPAPPGEYRLVAVVTKRQSPPIGPILSSPVIIDVQ
jgi:hypothetical protein